MGANATTFPHAAQVFTPKEFRELTATGSVNVESWRALMVPDSDVTIQLNDDGESVTLEAGRAIGVARSVTTINFTGFTDSIVVWIM